MAEINTCDEKMDEINTCNEKMAGFSIFVENTDQTQNINEKMENKEKLVTCHDCVKKSPASKHCKECQLNLCEKCVEYHQGSVKFADHTILDLVQSGENIIDQVSRYCKTHKELLKYFCEDCKVLVCNDCMISMTHQNHKFGLIDEVKLRIKQEIEEMITRNKVVLEELIKLNKQDDEFEAQIKKSKIKSLAIIDSVFQELHNILDQKKAEITQKLNVEYQQDKSFENSKEKEEDLRKVLQYSESVCNSQLGFDGVEKLKKVKNQMLVVCNQFNGHKIRNMNNRHIFNMWMVQNKKTDVQSLFTLHTRRFRKCFGNVKVDLNDTELEVNCAIKGNITQCLEAQIGIF